MNSEIEILEKYISKIKRAFKNQLKGILLFGSYAEEKNDFESDIDIIVAAEKMPPIEKRNSQRRKIEGIDGAGIDALWLTTEELELMVKNKETLILAAFGRGRILYDDNNYLAALRENLKRELKEKGVLEIEDGWIWRLKNVGEEIVL